MNFRERLAKAINPSDNADTNDDSAANNDNPVPAEAGADANTDEQERTNTATEGTPTGAATTNADQNFIASDEIEPNKSAIRLGDEWAEMMSINQFPDYLPPGVLYPLIRQTRFKFDFGMRLDPVPRTEFADDLEDYINDLDVADSMAFDDANTTGQITVDQRQTLAQQTYKEVTNRGMSGFAVSGTLAHRGDDPAHLTTTAHKEFISSVGAQTDIDFRTKQSKQDLGAIAASPTPADPVGESHYMPASAVGSLFPFVGDTVRHEGGIDLGLDVYNGNPLIVNPYRLSSYTFVNVGDTGSGKSYWTKSFATGAMQSDEEIDVIVLDPMEGYVGLAEAFGDGAEHVEIGSDQSLNPLEIREVPPETLRRTSAKQLAERKREDIHSFLESFYAERDADLTSAKRTLFWKAVDAAYRDNDINLEDPTTHHRDSPTIRDIFPYIEDVANDPEAFADSGATTEVEEWAGAAGGLLVELAPFKEGGKYANLGEPTDINLHDARFTYLDMSAFEGGDGAGGGGLMIQLMFSVMYERIKQSDRKTMFIVDESRYITRNDQSLLWLETAFRHHRHHSLSIGFVTQTAEEFFTEESGEAILDNTAIINLQRITGFDKDIATDYFGLNERQYEFVRDEATKGETGSDGDGRGRPAESLVHIDGGGWYPIRNITSEAAHTVIDYDPREDAPEDLPAAEEVGDEGLREVVRAVLAARRGGGADAEGDPGQDVLAMLESGVAGLSREDLLTAITALADELDTDPGALVLAVERGEIGEGVEADPDAEPITEGDEISESPITNSSPSDENGADRPSEPITPDRAGAVGFNTNSTADTGGHSDNDIDAATPTDPVTTDDTDVPEITDFEFGTADAEEDVERNSTPNTNESTEEGDEDDVDADEDENKDENDDIGGINPTNPATADEQFVFED